MIKIKEKPETKKINDITEFNVTPLIGKEDVELIEKYWDTWENDHSPIGNDLHHCFYRWDGDQIWFRPVDDFYANAFCILGDVERFKEKVAGMRKRFANK